MVFKAKKKRRVRRMYRNTRVHHKRGFKVPCAIVLGFAPLVGKTVGNVQSMGWNTGLKESVSSLVPYNPNTGKMQFSNLGYGLLPIIAGVLVHKFIGGGLGINRALASSGIPFLQI